MEALSGLIGLRFIFLFVFGLILLLIGHQRLTKPMLSLKEGIRSSLGYGFLVYAALPFAALLLCLTIVGIPFGLLTLGVFVALVAFYKLFNVYFYTTLAIERRGGYNNIKPRKKI